jgi:RHS repeat-associated protein
MSDLFGTGPNWARGQTAGGPAPRAGSAEPNPGHGPGVGPQPTGSAPSRAQVPERPTVRPGQAGYGGPELPGITMPKGGGAIKGIDEKLSVGLATGAVSLSLPVPASPGRQGFGPGLALTYSSGAGNGPFGLGWQLAVPSVTRKTSLGLPRYQDAFDSDVFIMSGAEDLVPLLVEDAHGWSQSVGPDPSGTYTVKAYRPRVESGFARIEQWREMATGDVHWRTVSRDNVVTLFGRTPASRVFDPDDASRVFTWLADFSYDDRGNAMAYLYKAEGTAQVPAAAHEDGRTVTANRYLKRVYYGNVSPYAPGGDEPTAWYFELVLDYGEHDLVAPTRDEAGPWACRPDPFSSYRSCFEVRTYRLCRRALMFHRFPDGADASAVVVRSLDFRYAGGTPADPALSSMSMLASATQTGWLGNGDGTFTTAQRPPLELTYSAVEVHDQVQSAGPDALANLPSGGTADGAGGTWRWCDLDGEGLPGVMAEDDGAWYYKRNISAAPPPGTPRDAEFEPLAAVALKPDGPGAGRSPELVDLHGDGRLCVVDFSPPTPGYFGRDDLGRWRPWKAFPGTAAIDWRSAYVRLVDLDGDGLADVLLSEQDGFTWWPFEAEDGFGAPGRVPVSDNEQQAPGAALDEGDWSVFLADMSGDGLADLVRVRNGEVVYWPNTGFGRFGAKVVMDQAPWFDAPDLFDARRVHFADIDGSGTADIVYAGTTGVTLWFNQSGNSFSAPTTLAGLAGTVDEDSLSVLDLLGEGTSCLAWSSPLPGESGRQLRYVDLMGGTKPHLLTGVANNMGLETSFTWATSTMYYVQDMLAGQAWLTRLPFPVHVVAQRQVLDRVSGTQLTTSYSYHHGYFDPVEREFRGFARVEQTDTDYLPLASGTGTFTDPPAPGPGGAKDEFALAPVLTRTWFSTGAYLGGQSLEAALALEWWGGDPMAPALGPTVFSGPVAPGQMTTEETREASRALRGRPLRTEVYALDGQPASSNPYAVTTSRYSVRLLQPPSPPSYGSFYCSPLEELSLHYERDANDPRAAHTLVLETDAYGAVTKSAAAAYPRRVPAYPEQAATLVTYAEADYLNMDDQAGWYRLALPVESRQYELTGFSATGSSGLFDPAVLVGQAGAAPEIAPSATPSGSTPEKRLLGKARTVYRANDLSGPLPLGQAQSLALVDRGYQLVATADMISALYGPVATPAQLNALATGAGGYVDMDGDGTWWSPTQRSFYSPDPNAPDPAYASQHFYLAQGGVSPFGGVTAVSWEHDLVVTSVTDAAGNASTAQFNYRVMQPWLITDANNNRNGGRYDALGLVTAAACMGKALLGGGDHGDHLDLSTDEASASDDPTSTFDYDLSAYMTWAANPVRDNAHPQPVWSHTRTRTYHKDPTTPWVESYTYLDGLGRVAMTKTQAEPGTAPARNPDGTLERDGSGSLVFAETSSRWVGTGKVVYDNKANPVKSYEPFFDSTPAFTDEVDLVLWGVTAIKRYDPLNRVVRLDKPSGTYRSCAFGPWQSSVYDEVDNVLDSAWYAARSGGALGPLAATAAAKSAASAGTPFVVDFDSAGRPFRSTADDGPSGKYTTTVQMDVLGRLRSTTDSLGRTAVAQDYDIPGAVAHQLSIDSGERWLLHAADGKALASWDSRGVRLDWQYDVLRRPTAVLVTGSPGPQRTAELTTYGEAVAGAVALNLRGSAYQHFDEAGLGTTQARDFEGNVTSMSRQYLATPGPATDWAVPPALASETFTTTATYDALRRPVDVTTPDGSVSSPTFNVRNLLESMSVRVRGAATATTFVAGASYNAKGQRQSMAYGNGAASSYTYDPKSFRLTELVTTRPPGGSPVQDLKYTYDAVGNVSHIGDAAQQTVFFANQAVSADNDYTYDALYRLVEATGRELLANAAAPQVTWDDSARVSGPLPSDTRAMQAYKEVYEYDAVGNFTSQTHTAAVGSWGRTYAYDEPAVPAGNNHLTSTKVGATTETYTYDANGNVTSMPQLPTMTWDWKNMLQSSASQVTKGGTPPTTWYAYDQNGQRTEKYTTGTNGAITKQRLYIGPFELYREYSSTGAVTLERQSLHVSDGNTRICLVETTTVDTSAPSGAPGAVPTPALRYQLVNLIGSAVVELDESAAVISFEEFFPYGSTSFEGGRSAAEVGLKRYRYTGKERDDETGFYYHGARYYAPWLGRWASCDPGGFAEGPSLYTYVKGNPVRFTDPDGRGGDDDTPRASFGIRVDAKPVSVGGLVLAFGRYEPGRPSYMKTAEDNTGLSAINIQDRINIYQERGIHWAYVKSDGTQGNLSFETEQDWLIAGAKPGERDVYPIFSGLMVQAGLEGDVAGTLHFDMRGVDLTPELHRDAAFGPKAAPAGLSAYDFHSSAEARQVVGHLASTGPGERKVDIVIQHEEGVTTITKDSNVATGDPLPQRLAERMPNITSGKPSPPGSGSGTPGAGDGETEGGTSSGASSGVSRAVSTGDSQSGTGGSSSGEGAGGSRFGAVVRSTTEEALGAVGRAVPGVAEGEAALTTAAYYAAQTSWASGAVTPLLTAAETLPVAAGAGVVGAAAGHAVRAAALAAGASEETANTIGLAGAVIGGAVAVILFL